MSIALLEYAPTSQNQRVSGFEIPGDESPHIYTTADHLTNSDMDDLIQAAYRQVFNEQQMTASSRQPVLESQLRAGKLTVRGFIQGLATSEVFRSRNYDPNNNYRVAQMCVQRLLGRDIYSDREKMAWSIVLATQGLNGLVEALLSSKEFLNAFGENTVPYQRRRILPQHPQGDLPFARLPRYDQSHLEKLNALGYNFSANRYVPGSGMPSLKVQQLGGAFAYMGSALLSLGILWVVLSWFGWVKI
ncbi:phycobilisome rod-core linker polypeptide CpcG [Synechococcales cyanobacterium C]|uniref:Phycobilisome rod-core linker polypeptide CpcG n=1 Tax=Petrachloros mirabilis ULC683 TaxID=2781853 RepID=A0A8K1ZYG5_9CYAN|nr:phycobilisome rod-core linker polypeptide [Petrachloros mirabilis]NCJ07173.1 phycobilisome rod-core linker polypeptide CpcG [Petrachloros mirabilis ULC683]